VRLKAWCYGRISAVHCCRLLLSVRPPRWIDVSRPVEPTATKFAAGAFPAGTDRRTDVTCLSYRVSRSTLTAVGRSQLLTRRPGTHSRSLSAIQRTAQTVLGVYLKRTCWRVISASSALGILNDYAAIQIHALIQFHKPCRIVCRCQ